MGLGANGWRAASTPRPGASGAGYLDLYTPANGVTNYFHPGISTPLSDLLGPNSLGFLHSGATAFQLRIRWADRTDGDLTGFTTLVWEPPTTATSARAGGRAVTTSPPASGGAPAT